MNIPQINPRGFSHAPMSGSKLNYLNSSFRSVDIFIETFFEDLAQSSSSHELNKLENWKVSQKEKNRLQIIFSLLELKASTCESTFNTYALEQIRVHDECLFSGLKLLSESISLMRMRYFKSLYQAHLEKNDTWISAPSNRAAQNSLQEHTRYFGASGLHEPQEPQIVSQSPGKAHAKNRSKSNDDLESFSFLRPSAQLKLAPLGLNASPEESSFMDRPLLTVNKRGGLVLRERTMSPKTQELPEWRKKGFQAGPTGPNSHRPTSPHRSREPNPRIAGTGRLQQMKKSLEEKLASLRKKK